MDAEALTCLHAWLRTNFPHDVLIPCAKGEKRPLFQYKDGAWSVEMLDAFRGGSAATRSETDWAIVLHQICVIDVDDPLAAAALEVRFPVLLTAPCETSRRGKHYFFRRSSLADELGYWDSCGQVRV